MMYVLGMSHAINVLKAASCGPLSFSHENWVEQTSAGQFFDVHAKPGLIAGDVLKAFIVSPAAGWGGLAELRTLPDGQQQVAATEGFIHLLSSLETAQDDSVLFSFVNGNEHSALSMVQHAQPYDFYLPWREDRELAAGTQPVPYEIIRRQVERALNATIGALAMMRVKLPRMRLVHVLSPPPIESEEHIMKTPEVFREHFARWGITPFSIRAKYHALAADILRQALRPFKVELLENPPQTLSANGALKGEYAFAATHANEAYGELVVKQMQDLANSKG